MVAPASSRSRCATDRLEAAGHVQSHLRWGFGGGEATPEDLFCCCFAAQPQNNNKKWGLGRSPKDFAHALLEAGATFPNH